MLCLLHSITLWESEATTERQIRAVTFQHIRRQTSLRVQRRLYVDWPDWEGVPGRRILEWRSTCLPWNWLGRRRRLSVWKYVIIHHIVTASALRVWDYTWYSASLVFMRQPLRTSAQVWHALSKDHKVLPATHAFFHERIPAIISLNKYKKTYQFKTRCKDDMVNSVN